MTKKSVQIVKIGPEQLLRSHNESLVKMFNMWRAPDIS